MATVGTATAASAEYVEYQGYYCAEWMGAGNGLYRYTRICTWSVPVAGCIRTRVEYRAC